MALAALFFLGCSSGPRIESCARDMRFELDWSSYSNDDVARLARPWTRVTLVLHPDGSFDVSADGYYADLVPAVGTWEWSDRELILRVTAEADYGDVVTRGLTETHDPSQWKLVPRPRPYLVRVSIVDSRLEFPAWSNMVRARVRRVQ
jgi:hypothetical protein